MLLREHGCRFVHLLLSAFFSIFRLKVEQLCTRSVRAVLFVVDSADRERLGLAASELGAMLAEEELRGAALAVLANKSDLPGAASPAEVAGALKLAALKDRRWQLFRTSALRGDGLPETMEWCAGCIFTKTVLTGVHRSIFSCMLLKNN